jgi:DNA-binding transcriptional LysR family regulator
LKKKKRLALQDLSGVPLIVRDGRGATDKVLNQHKAKGVSINVTLRCISPDGVKAAVRRKMGVGILFYNLIEDDVKRADLKTLKIADLPTIVGNSYIVYSKKKPLSAGAAKFLALLRSLKKRQRGASENNKEE